MNKGFTNILIILILGVTLLLGGYYLGKQSDDTQILIPQEQTNLITQESTPSSQPTPKSLVAEVVSSPKPASTSTSTPNPLPYQLILGAQVNTYKNSVYGFSFNLPKSLFFYNSQTSVSKTTFLERQDDINAVRFGFEVIKTNTSLEDLANIRGLDKRYEQSFNLEAGMINGHEALYIASQKSMREICNMNSDEKRRIVLAALVRNRDYVLELTTNNTCDTFQTNWFDIIIASRKHRSFRAGMNA